MLATYLSSASHAASRRKAAFTVFSPGNELLYYSRIVANVIINSLVQKQCSNNVIILNLHIPLNTNIDITLEIRKWERRSGKILRHSLHANNINSKWFKLVYRQKCI